MQLPEERAISIEVRGYFGSPETAVLTTPTGATVIGGLTVINQDPTPEEYEELLNRAVTVREFEERKILLWRIKKVADWPQILDPIDPNPPTVNLTPRECHFLGGKIEYWESCGTTNLKCVAANGNEMCIDEFK